MARTYASREKMFGCARGIPLDRNAKIRIMAAARAWSARHKLPGQHKGPITRSFLDVLQALLWGFHNARDGRCFPSYEAIAAKAGCCRDTVHQAIKMLEFADILSWVNRIVRVRCQEKYHIFRTSNAYIFRDPMPCAAAKSEIRTETNNPVLSLRVLPIEEGLRTSMARFELAFRGMTARKNVVI